MVDYHDRMKATRQKKKPKFGTSFNPLVHTGKYTTDYDNLPERYMIKKTTQVEWKSPNDPR